MWLKFITFNRSYASFQNHKGKKWKVVMYLCIILGNYFYILLPGAPVWTITSHHNYNKYMWSCWGSAAEERRWGTWNMAGKGPFGKQPGLQICIQSEFFCYYILVAFVFCVKFHLKKISCSWTCVCVCVYT